MQGENSYEVGIVGGGVTGTALLHTLSEYTTIDSVALFEQYDDVAPADEPSHSSSNSQTLHAGDIETNYSREKSAEVKDAADLVVGYAEQAADTDAILHPMQKMVLGVGDDEVEQLIDRYDAIQDLYPALELIGRNELREREPALVNGREPDETVAALCSDDGYAVDFGALSHSFVAEATADDTETAVHTGTTIEDITTTGDTYTLATDDGTYETDALVVAAGTASLPLAQSMGYGEEYTQLPVAGGFYFGPEDLELNGKVYTVQNEKLPFAAVHGDPDIDEDGRVRFGPTAQPVFSTEWTQDTGTIPKMLHPDNLDRGVLQELAGRGAIRTLGDMLLDRDVAKFMAKNALYELPRVGRKTFLRDAQKIMPSLSADDLSYAADKGGVRPQIIDTAEEELLLGEAKIVDDDLIVNMTPSPGASNCLQNAADDAEQIASALDAEFDEDRFYNELQRSPSGEQLHH